MLIRGKQQDKNTCFATTPVISSSFSSSCFLQRFETFGSSLVTGALLSKNDVGLVTEELPPGSPKPLKVKGPSGRVGQESQHGGQHVATIPTKLPIEMGATAVFSVQPGTWGIQMKPTAGFFTFGRQLQTGGTCGRAGLAHLHPGTHRVDPWHWMLRCGSCELAARGKTFLRFWRRGGGVREQ